jgi:hypothetical protein
VTNRLASCCAGKASSRTIWPASASRSTRVLSCGVCSRAAEPQAKWQAKTVASSEFEELKKELLEKERALADMAIEVTLLRKNQWVFDGPIAAQRLKVEIKLEILSVIDSSLRNAVSVRRAAETLQIVTMAKDEKYTICPTEF